LPIDGVLQFLRRTGYPVVRPELLGLPPATGQGRGTLDRALAQGRAALESGDAQRFERIVFDLYLGGHSACDLCDRVIAPALQEIGDRWQHGDVEVYEERRACEICMRTLYALRDRLPLIPESAPTAIGATLEGDPYTIPTQMVELALREAGWLADSYGIGLPAETLCSAIRTLRPRLFWLSVSTIASEAGFLATYPVLYETAAEQEVPIVVGGRALTPEIRKAIAYSAHGDTLRHLVSFARTQANR
jgi:methanogenic corrinoid protein MtbC1